MTKEGFDPFAGAVSVPLGPGRRVLALVPHQARVVEMVTIDDGEDEASPVELVGYLSEGQLRALGRACEAVACWLDEHT